MTQSSRFYEVQKYFTWTNHVYSGAMIVINEDYYQTMPEDIQAILNEEGALAGDLQIKWNRENVDKAIKIMEDYGVTVSEITPELKTAFEDAAKKVWDQFKSEYDTSAMDYIFNNLSQ